MRIGINALFLQQPNTGSGQYTRHLLSALRQGDPSVRIVLLDGPLAPRAGRRGEDAEKLLWEQIAVPLLAVRREVDLLHVPYWAPPLVARVPVVATVHDVIPAVLPEYRGSRLVQAYTTLVSIAARRAQRLLVDSECSKRDLVRVVGVPAERVDVVPLAASPSFRPLAGEEAASACRDRWGIRSSFMLYVGSNDARKNVPGLLRAWSLAAPHLPEHQLVVAGTMRGDSPLFSDVHSLARQLALPRLRFLGPVTDREKHVLLGACTAFVWPSRYEGFGLPPLEAMQVGAPVISSDRSAMAEVVGDAGILVSPDDLDAMAGAMVSVSMDDSLRDRLRSAGLARASQFTWEKTAELTLEAYRRTVRR